MMRTHTILLQTLLIVLVVLGGLWFLGNQQGPSKLVRLGNQTFYAMLADDDIERAQGLSGTNSLATNRAMLFEFEVPDTYCFWMKDMNYPLDIIFINENKQIVTRYKDLPPDSYPKSFCSAELSKYVLEVPAGTADRLNLKLGDSVSF
jgi:uncharacterized protein